MKKYNIGLVVTSEVVPSYVNNCVQTLLNSKNIQITIIKFSKTKENLNANQNFLKNLFKLPKLLKSEKIIGEYISEYNIKLEQFDFFLILENNCNLEFISNHKIFYINIINDINCGYSKYIINNIINQECFFNVSILDNNLVNIITHNYKTTRHSYTKTLQLALSSLPDLLLDFIKNYKKLTLISCNTTKDIETIRNKSLFNILLKIIFNKIKHNFNIFFSNTVWNIGLIDLPIDEIAFGENRKINVTWETEIKGNNFKADPFGISTNEYEIYIYEYFDSKLKKGHLRIKSNTNPNMDDVILDRNYHLSYPYLFNHQNEWYCIPEQCESNKIDLYKLDLLNKKLIFQSSIIENISAVDPTILFAYNKWWLFCTQSERKGADLKLYIYYSDDLENNWLPHALNPVKTDICSARPAGTPFIYEGKIIRPSQDSSKSYGGSIRLNEIIILTENDYQENYVKTLNPNIFGDRYPNGIHTISKMGNKTIIDGKRINYSIRNLLIKLTN